MMFLFQVNVTNFESSEKCSSNPLEFDTKLGPAKLATKKEWDDSRWGSETTLRPEDQGPIWEKNSGEPRPRLPPTDPISKEWNDIVWSSESKVSALDVSLMDFQSLVLGLIVFFSRKGIVHKLQLQLKRQESPLQKITSETPTHLAVVEV